MKIAAVAAVGLFFSACAVDTVIHKGRVADGVYLVTWVATDRVAERCGEPRAAGCAKLRVQAVPGGAVRTVEIVVPHESGQLHEIAAHEVCHALAAGLAKDPCRSEDGGVVTDASAAPR